MARNRPTRLSAAATGTTAPYDADAKLTLHTRLVLPAWVHHAYETAADANDSTLDAELQSRLIACAQHTASRALYIPDQQRLELEALLGKSIFSAEELLLSLRAALTFSIAVPDSDGEARPVTLQLPFPLLERVLARKWDHNESVESHLTKLVQNALAREVGW